MSGDIFPEFPSQTCHVYGGEQRARTYRRCGPMTTYRRFCCDDLLRLGSLNLCHDTITHCMLIYMGHLAMWPGNCHVADGREGQIMGYIFGDVAGEGADCTGQLSMIALPTMDLMGLGRQLANLLEDCCGKIYNAYTMRIFLSLPDSHSRNIMNKLGYQLFMLYEDKLEMRKPLARLMALVGEQTQEESMKPPT